MQLITFLSATTALMASTVAARDSAVQLNAACKLDQPYARIVNRCDYPVHIWSVLKTIGCDSAGMVTLKKGEVYTENLYTSTESTGVSIKISKTQQCKGNDITQLEYHLNQEPGKEAWWNNYLDVSYVDCLSDDCPTRQEGYYFVAGNQTGPAKASADNTWCPILACHDVVSCSKLSYVLPDDVQTKTCDVHSNMDFYMCGGEAPTEEYGSSPASPVSSKPSVVSIDDNYKIKAAAVTPAPAVDSDSHIKTKTQVEVVYVTAYEYVNAKRHAHGHARRHQAFNA